jgi:heme-degrading monooxygenase HmoA
VLIIAGKLYVDPETREEYLASLEGTIRRARTHPGCLDCALAADPVEAGQVNQFELWESEEHFASWQAVVDPPTPVTEILVADVKKYEISASGPVFS